MQLEQKMKWIVTSLLILALVSPVTGCALFETVVEKPVYIVKEDPGFPRPKPLKLETIEFIVITENSIIYKGKPYKDLTELFAHFKEQNISPALVAMIDVDYRKLSVNNRKVLEFIRAQDALLKDYNRYYQQVPTVE